MPGKRNILPGLSFIYSIYRPARTFAAVKTAAEYKLTTHKARLKALHAILLSNSLSKYSDLQYSFAYFT